MADLVNEAPLIVVAIVLFVVLSAARIRWPNS